MCLKHVPPVTLPATAEQCWMRGCSSQRPSTQDRPEEASAPAPPPSAVLEAAGVQICAWEGCNSPARPNSKYCSRKCSNKNARKRFRARKREQAA
ncbi:MAG: hypothetical protein CSA66_01555 [Proteobacteria bacterium]|nr:MAG: hypothetical protein CSA66_01555 [Pseudomonadota bacterium]